MPQNPRKDTPRISPYLFLYYADVAAAIDGLMQAFGLKEGLHLPGRTEPWPTPRWNSTALGLPSQAPATGLR